MTDPELVEKLMSGKRFSFYEDGAYGRVTCKGRWASDQDALDISMRHVESGIMTVLRLDAELLAHPEVVGLEFDDARHELMSHPDVQIVEELYRAQAHVRELSERQAAPVVWTNKVLGLRDWLPEEPLVFGLDRTHDQHRLKGVKVGDEAREQYTRLAFGLRDPRPAEWPLPGVDRAADKSRLQGVKVGGEARELHCPGCGKLAAPEHVEKRDAKLHAKCWWCERQWTEEA